MTMTAYAPSSETLHVTDPIMSNEGKSKNTQNHKE